MTIDVLPNRGPASVGAEMERLFHACTVADLASAFMTPSGMKRLREFLGVGGKPGRPAPRTIRLVVGLYNRFTPPGVLQELLRLSRQNEGTFQVRIASNIRFHWKAYLFQQGSRTTAIVGSANLTDDGLFSSGELSLRVRGRGKGDAVSSIRDEFDQLWEKETLELNEKFIAAYSRLPRLKRPFIGDVKDTFLSKMLRPPLRSRSRLVSTGKKPIGRRPLYVVYIDENFSDETQAILSSETNWDTKGYWYFAPGTKKLWTRIKDYHFFVLVTWFNAKSRDFKVELHQVTEDVQLKTPDGKYFIAHRQVRGTRSVRLKNVASRLQSSGLSKKRMMQEPELNAAQIAVLFEILKVPNRVKVLFGRTEKRSH
jgi:HKD family nuclease